MNSILRTITHDGFKIKIPTCKIIWLIKQLSYLFLTYYRKYLNWTILVVIKLMWLWCDDIEVAHTFDLCGGYTSMDVSFISNGRWWGHFCLNVSSCYTDFYLWHEIKCFRIECFGYICAWALDPLVYKIIKNAQGQTHNVMYHSILHI